MSLFADDLLTDVVVAERYRVVRTIRVRAESLSFLTKDLRSKGRQVLLRLMRRPPHPVDDHMLGDQRLQHHALLAYSDIFAGLHGLEMAQLALFGPDVVCVARPYGKRTLSDGRRKRPLATVETTIRDVTEALCYLHGSGHVHGDLRPGNIVWYQAKYYLADYALPRLHDFGNREVQRTISHWEYLAAELPFLAPEILDRAAPTPASDAFSLGVLALMLVGDDDWAMQSRMGASHIRLRVDLPARRRRIYEDVIDACLRPDPALRPTSEQLRDALLGNSEQAQAQMQRMLEDQRTLGLAHSFYREAPEHLRNIDLEGAALRRAAARLIMQTKGRPSLTFAYASQQRLAARLAESAMLLTAEAYNKDIVGPHAKSTQIEELSIDESPAKVDLYEPPPEIDGVWLRRIHEHFRIRTLRVPRQALPDVASAADKELLNPGREQLLEWIEAEVAAANTIRAKILAEPFVLISGAIETLRRTVPRIDREGIAEMRSSGALLGLPDHGRLLYPSFQFRPNDGSLFAMVGQVSELLDAAQSPWGVVDWWRQPHVELGGREPRRLLGTEDEGLIMAAARASLGTSAVESDVLR